MASNNNPRFLHDIKIKSNPFAYNYFLNSPLTGGAVYNEALKVVRLYQAAVGVKTGRLKASANASVAPSGGKMNDRMVGKATIAGQSVVADEPYKGKPFYYGVYHEEGNKRKGRRRRRKHGVEGYHELRQVAHRLRGSP